MQEGMKRMRIERVIIHFEFKRLIPTARFKPRVSDVWRSTQLRGVLDLSSSASF